MAQGQISDTNTRIVIVLPKEIKIKADIIANSDGRSLSGWVRNLITNEVKNIMKTMPSKYRLYIILHLFPQFVSW